MSTRTGGQHPGGPIASKTGRLQQPGRGGAGARSRSGQGARQGQRSTFRFDAAIGALLLVPFVMVLGNSILIPVLPAMRQAMNLSPAQTGLIITAFSVPAGVLIPFAGFLADRYGRKAVMVPSLVTYGVGGAIAIAAAVFLEERAYGLLMVGRVVQGLGAAGTANIAMALAGDLYAGTARGQALGLLEASNGFGKVVSPVLGAALGLASWFFPFVLFTALALPVAAAVGLLARDAKPEGRLPAGRYLASILGVFREKGVSLGAALASGMVVLFLLFGVLFFLSETLETRFGLTGVLKGFVLALPVLASAVTAYVTGTYLQRLGRRWLVVGGLSLITLVLASLAVVDNPYYLYGAIFLIGVGSGSALATLNVLVTGSVPLRQRGMITSDYGAVRFFGVALGPPVFGLLMGLGRTVLFLSAAALAALVSAGAFFLIDEKRLSKKPAR